MHVALSPSNEQLARDAKAGDHGAFDQLHERLFRKVHAACACITGDREDASDLCVETLARAWGAMVRCSYDPGKVRSFDGWLLRIAKNVCIDHFRWHRRPWLSLQGMGGADQRDATEVPDEVWTPDRLPEWMAVREAWSALTPRQRLVLGAKYWAGETWQQVADGLGCTVEQARGEAARARRVLARRLDLA